MNTNTDFISKNIKNEELQNSLLDMNKSLRTDLKLSIAIYKQKNNFDFNYINNKLNNGLR